MRLEFLRPELLYLFLLLPIWVVVVWPRARRGMLFTRPGPSGGSARALAQSMILLGLPRVLRTAAIGALILALAGPERVDTTEEVSDEGMTIALAVDLSTSMLADDMDGRSRLDVAREGAIGFAERRTTDELSLVGFGGEAFTRVPPTKDNALVAAGVRSLRVDLVRNGTDISGAILTALSRLVDSPGEPKVIVLLTDGAHNAAGLLPLAAARAAAAVGVRIHSIGVVSPEQTVPGAGSSSEVSTEEVETVLQGVSSLTGGRYFRATSAALLESVYREIDRLESSVPTVIQVETRHSERIAFLVAALLLVGLGAVVRGSRWGVIP